MKQKVKIVLKEGATLPKVISKGDWIDLYMPNDVSISGMYFNRKFIYHTEKIDLGIAMELPDGYEAIIVGRSSNLDKKGIMQANGISVIDNSYKGNNDTWKYPVVAFRNTILFKGSRVCQFKIQLSQKATIWQKIKWLFTSGFEFEVVDNLNNDDRDGFGSTGD